MTAQDALLPADRFTWMVEVCICDDHKVNLLNFPQQVPAEELFNGRHYFAEQIESTVDNEF